MALIVDFHRDDIPMSSMYYPAYPSQTQHNTILLSSSRRRRRRVTFNDEVEVTFVKDLSIDHKADLWFTEDEMKYVKREMIYDLKELRMNLKEMITTSDDSDSDNELLHLAAHDTTTTSSFLGLENCLTPSTYRAIRLRRKVMRAAIMYEQRRQERIGVCEPDLLANVSEVESDWSRRRALVIGMLHADDR